MSTPKAIRKARKQRRAEWDDPADSSTIFSYSLREVYDRGYAMPMAGEVSQGMDELTAALGLSLSRIEGKGMNTSRRSPR
jgi:hypothetical protein